MFESIEYFAESTETFPLGTRMTLGKRRIRRKSRNAWCSSLKSLRAYGIIKTDEAGTLDFSGVPAFFVTTVLIVQCSAAYNVHRIEPYLISSTVAFSSSKVL